VGQFKFIWSNHIVISKAKINELSFSESCGSFIVYSFCTWGHRGCDCMVVGFTTICAISAYHH